VTTSMTNDEKEKAEKEAKDKINKIIDVINSSPTSTNSQDFSAIIVNDKSLREKISLNLETQKHIVNAPLFIIFCADINRIKYAAQKENKNIHTNSLNNFLTSSGDAFIAASFAANAAIQLGLGTCYIGMVRASLEIIKQALKLEGNIVPVVGLTIGYIDKQNEIKPKINHVYLGEYKIEQLQQEVDSYNEQMLSYYDSRNSKQKYNTWANSCLPYFEKSHETDDLIDKFIKKTWNI
ncbi:MAG: nitroreductase family protein, partial [Malacoplasma sp.]|nr:nitroreductase family protein [Malacoplasma sp.]